MDFGVDDVAAGKDAQLIYYKIAAAVKKGVAAHKLGEAGFKVTAQGTYWNAHENHNETFKLIEDAIASVGVNVSYSLLNYLE